MAAAAEIDDDVHFENFPELRHPDASACDAGPEKKAAGTIHHPQQSATQVMPAHEQFRKDMRRLDGQADGFGQVEPNLPNQGIDFWFQWSGALRISSNLKYL